LSRTWPFSVSLLAITRLRENRKNQSNLSIRKAGLSSAECKDDLPLKPASYFFMLSRSAANSAKAPLAVATTGSGFFAPPCGWPLP